MTLTLNLTSNEETRLQTLAAMRGVDLEKYARLRLGLETRTESAAPQTEADWDALEAELSEGIDPAIPPLSDSALSRAAMYGNRA